MNQCGALHGTVIPTATLTGEISTIVSLTGEISTIVSLIGEATIPHIVPVQPYEGDYSVVPKVVSDVILPTEGKQMKSDVAVLKIPQYEVSNDAGGKTLIMGDEYYG